MSRFIESLENRQFLSAVIDENPYSVLDEATTDVIMDEPDNSPPIMASPIYGATKITIPGAPTGISGTASRVYVNGISKSRMTVKWKPTTVIPTGTKIAGYVINIVHNNVVEAALKTSPTSSVALTGNFKAGDKYFVKVATFVRWDAVPSKTATSVFSGVWITAK